MSFFQDWWISIQCEETRGEGHIIFARNTHVEHGHWNQQVAISKVMSHSTSPSFYSRLRIVDFCKLYIGICRFLSWVVDDLNAISYNFMTNPMVMLSHAKPDTTRIWHDQRGHFNGQAGSRKPANPARCLAFQGNKWNKSDRDRIKTPDRGYPVVKNGNSKSKLNVHKGKSSKWGTVHCQARVARGFTGLWRTAKGLQGTGEDS